jgi:SnoaL-like domain
MDRPRVGRPPLFVAHLPILLVVAGALTLGACGSRNATNSTKPTPTSSAMASPTAAASPASPVATPTTTAQVVAAYAAALKEFRSPIDLFSRDARSEDRAIGDVRRGWKAVKAFQEYFQGGQAGITTTPRSWFAGSDGAILEERGDWGFGAGYVVNLFRIHDGKITTWYVYLSDMLSDRVPKLAPALLKTPPGPSDTETVSRRSARAYMTALQALAPARLAALYAHDVVYQDTSRDIRYAGSAAAVAEHAKMFALRGVRFQANGVLDGPGWAAVMWRRTDREGGKPPVGYPAELAKWAIRPTIHGVSILEIRDGKIARETIYSDHLRTRY